MFVTISNAGTKINLGVNAKNSLTKVYATKDLFGILAFVSVNLINLAILVSIDKLVEECTENIEAARLVEKKSARNKY